MPNPSPAVDRIAARRRRVARLRRRAAGGCLAVFVAATIAVLVQLTSGHDPALARSAQSATTTTPAPSANSTGARTGTSASSGASAGATVSPMTTHAS